MISYITLICIYRTYIYIWFYCVYIPGKRIWRRKMKRFFVVLIVAIVVVVSLSLVNLLINKCIFELSHTHTHIQTHTHTLKHIHTYTYKKKCMLKESNIFRRVLVVYCRRHRLYCCSCRLVVYIYWDHEYVYICVCVCGYIYFEIDS